MSWWVCRDEDNNVFPVRRLDNNTIEIPFLNDEGYFSYEDWQIMKTVATKDGMTTLVYRKLTGFQPLVCDKDVERQMAKRRALLGATVSHDGIEYEISILKRENHDHTIFSAINTATKNHHEIMVTDDKMFIGIDGQWIEKLK